MSIVVTDNENGSRVVYLDVEQMLGAAGVVTLVVAGERHPPEIPLPGGPFSCLRAAAATEGSGSA